MADSICVRRGGSGNAFSHSPSRLDRAPECGHAGQSIDDGFVVGFGQRLGIAQLSREPPRRRIGRIECRRFPERQLKLAVCFERVAGLAVQLERGGQAERGLVGCRRSTGILARMRYSVTASRTNGRF